MISPLGRVNLLQLERMTDGEGPRGRVARVYGPKDDSDYLTVFTVTVLVAHTSSPSKRGGVGSASDL
jgi:hypothetical protein